MYETERDAPADSNTSDRPVRGSGRGAGEPEAPLRHPDRRFVYRHLAERERPVTVRELAQALLAHDDVPGATDDKYRIERVRRRLYHDHLPRMADYGLVEWSPDDPTITVVAAE